MKLGVMDQIHVSAVQADSLRKGDQIDVSDATGEELLKRHPGVFEQLPDAPGEKKAPAPKNKAAAKAKNKAAAADPAEAAEQPGDLLAAEPNPPVEGNNEG